jgi:protein-S-isoprenylcysteine O-methyltransferase Ste14
MDHVYLVLAWCGYFFLHSWLASEGVKARISRLAGKWFHYYRLTYSVLSTMGLVFLIWFARSLPGSAFFTTSFFTLLVGFSLASAGILLIGMAFRHYRFSEFIGLRSEAHEALHMKGILKKIRHPIYSGTVLIVLGYFVYSPGLSTLLSALCIFTYLPVGIWLEEKKLIRQFGQAYLDYKKRVPALVPRWW